MMRRNEKKRMATPTASRLGIIGVTDLFSFPNGGYRIQTIAPSQSPDALGNGRTGSLRPTSYSDFYLAVDLVDWHDSLP